jgi:hypothetical protein
MKRTIIVAVLAAIAVTALAACSRYATATSDTHICVFDGSERGGQKLKFQIPPGADSKKIDDNDQVVKIPASNRFYMANSDRNVADPGAPAFYEGNARGGTPVHVEGQVRFRFNLSKACEWFSKHGRRNAGDDGDLGFNARGNPAEVAQQGWFRFLNENFGITMKEVVGETMNHYDWAFLHYNFPGNASEAGILPAGQEAQEATRTRLGSELGAAFTERLKANLGGDYFCGIDSDAGGGDAKCPTMRFQVTYAGPGNDSSLVKDREQVEQTKQKLETARLQGELQGAQQQALIAAEKAKAQLLAEEANTAELQAKKDTAKCRQLAQHGLDCEGKRAPVYINGQPAG